MAAAAAASRAGRDTSLKVAVVVTPLCFPIGMYLGRGLEDRAFLGELDQWCRKNEYAYSEDEKAAAKICGKSVVSLANQHASVAPFCSAKGPPLRTVQLWTPLASRGAADWMMVPVLSCGSGLASWLGPRSARRLPPPALPPTAATCDHLRG